MGKSAGHNPRTGTGSLYEHVSKFLTKFDVESPPTVGSTSDDWPQIGSKLRCFDQNVLKSKALIALLAKSEPSRPAIVTFNIRPVGSFAPPQSLVTQRSNYLVVGRCIGDLRALRHLRRLRRRLNRLNHHGQPVRH